MPKQTIWVLVIAAGVFLGAFGYEKFTEYRLQRALSQEMANLQAVISKSNAKTKQIQLANQQAQAKREAEKQQRKQLEVYRNTACAINVDKNTCVCLNEKTGARVNLAYDECVKRAKELSW